MTLHSIKPAQIELKDVTQSFMSNQKRITLFQQLNLTIEQGRSYAITGPSGSGKSSLLTLMSGLAEPTSGKCHYIGETGEQPVANVREKIGFIFQQFHLLPELTALNNVALPLKLRGVKDAMEKAKRWLIAVGLEHRINHKPAQLSGGEQQRVAIARALVFEPEFIFADEPTGNLDVESASEVADILFNCCKQKGAALVMVTHSDTLAAQAEQVMAFKCGTLEWQQQNQEVASYA